MGSRFCLTICHSLLHKLQQPSSCPVRQNSTPMNELNREQKDAGNARERKRRAAAKAANKEAARSVER